jgi:hypothetical protein
LLASNANHPFNRGKKASGLVTARLLVAITYEENITSRSITVLSRLTKDTIENSISQVEFENAPRFYHQSS